MSNRLPICVEQWPECSEGEYDPRCCRFPKSCSCEVDDDYVSYGETGFFKREMTDAIREVIAHSHSSYFLRHDVSPRGLEDTVEVLYRDFVLPYMKALCGHELE